MASIRAPSSSPPARARGSATPRLLGQYHVLGELGRNAIGAVHLARLEGPQGFQRWAALRIVSAEKKADRTFMREFFERAGEGASMLHPNVAALFDVGETEGVAWLATEYLEGERIEEIISRVQMADTPLSWELASRIVADAAEGLYALHSHKGPDGSPRGLLHGDLAPHSVMVTYEGKTKIKGAFEPRAHGTLDRRKLPYAAPEQIWGDPLDDRTDVFALGVILWELCAGTRLFARDTDDETRAMVEASVVPSLCDEVPGFPPEIDALVRRALGHKKEDRFTSARELSRALESALVGRGVLLRADDVGAYLRSLFADRYSERQSLLRDAADVTEVFLRTRRQLQFPPVKRDANGLLDLSIPETEADETRLDHAPPDAPTEPNGVMSAESADDLAQTTERPANRAFARSPSLAGVPSEPLPPVEEGAPEPITAEAPTAVSKGSARAPLTSASRERSGWSSSAESSGGMSPTVVRRSARPPPPSRRPPPEPITAVSHEREEDIPTQDAGKSTLVSPLERRTRTSTPPPPRPSRYPRTLQSSPPPPPANLGPFAPSPPPPAPTYAPAPQPANLGPFASQPPPSYAPPPPQASVPPAPMLRLPPVEAVPRLPPAENGGGFRAAAVGVGVAIALFAVFLFVMSSSGNEPDPVRPTPRVAAASASPASPTATPRAVASAAPTTPSVTTDSLPISDTVPTTAVTSLPVSNTSKHASGARANTAPTRTPTVTAPQGPARYGLLSVICTPACDQVKDGNASLGPSPIFKVSVTAGRHHLVLVGDDGRRKSVVVDVPEGDVALVRQDM